MSQRGVSMNDSCVSTKEASVSMNDLRPAGVWMLGARNHRARERKSSLENADTNRSSTLTLRTFHCKRTVYYTDDDRFTTRLMAGLLHSGRRKREFLRPSRCTEPPITSANADTTRCPTHPSCSYQDSYILSMWLSRVVYTPSIVVCSSYTSILGDIWLWVCVP